MLTLVLAWLDFSGWYSTWYCLVQMILESDSQPSQQG